MCAIQSKGSNALNMEWSQAHMGLYRVITTENLYHKGSSATTARGEFVYMSRQWWLFLLGMFLKKGLVTETMTLCASEDVHLSRPE